MNNLSIAILEDDEVYANTLARQLTRYEYEVDIFYCPEQLLNRIQQQSYSCLLLDMNLSGQSSLPFISLYRKQLPTAKIILVTGYASIASTVTAIKSGADDYLPKPLEFKKLVTLIAGSENPRVTEHAELDLKKPSPERLEWEYIQQALNDNQGNVSETARQLNMHRRTLQRKLAKKTVTK